LLRRYGDLVSSARTRPNPITTDERTRTLANGAPMPVLGLGVWLARPGGETENAVRWALEAGYRHIDTAQAYRNEESVGRALAASGIPREQVWVTTKFYPRSRDPEAEAEASLRRLGLEQLDLYLIHWPGGGPTWAWPAMERVLDRGLTRAIGVSNFGVRELDELRGAASVTPHVNQILFNPKNYRRELQARCEGDGIAVEAYSPLMHGRDLEDATIRRVADEVDRTAAQVLLRWGLQRDTIVIPKSVRRERIEENAGIFDFELRPEQMAALDALDRTEGTGRALERRWW
jgi:diketogulonate reductase-like aldo/keto reductase